MLREGMGKGNGMVIMWRRKLGKIVMD